MKESIEWIDKSLELLKLAELQFKLGLAIALTYHVGPGPNLEYYTAFSYGKHIARKRELKLSEDEEARAALLLEHTVTYMLVLQLHSVLDKLVPKHVRGGDTRLESAFQIARHIRNTFAHNPFAPVWMLPSNKFYEVPGIIELRTDRLDGKSVERLDYGGPIALLRLNQFVRRVIRKVRSG